jgi:hypothetical protein
VGTYSLRSKHRRLKEQHARLLARLDREDVHTAAGATAAGDPARLRGLPAIGRSVTGAIRGTSPHAYHGD